MSAADRTADMSPDELIAVITRGLDADEQTARKADAVTVDMDEPLAVIDGDEFTFLAVNPSRVLADVESKREILAQYDARFSDDFVWQPILAALARPYLDREMP